MFRSASLRALPLDGICRGFEAWCRERVLNSKSCIHHHRSKPLWLHWSLIQDDPRISKELEWSTPLLGWHYRHKLSHHIEQVALSWQETPTERHSVTFGRFSESSHWKCRVLSVIWCIRSPAISATAVCSLISTSWKDHTAWVHMAPSPAKSIGSKWEDWQKEQKENEKPWIKIFFESWLHCSHGFAWNVLMQPLQQTRSFQSLYSQSTGHSTPVSQPISSWKHKQPHNLAPESVFFKL